MAGTVDNPEKNPNRMISLSNLHNGSWPATIDRNGLLLDWSVVNEVDTEIIIIDSFTYLKYNKDL